MDGILREKLKKYSRYIEDYESVLDTLEELENSDKDAYLYTLEYISYVFNYLEVYCEQKGINLTDISDNEEDFEDYEDVDIEDGLDFYGIGGFTDYQEDSISEQDDFNFDEYEDQSEETDYDFEGINSGTEGFGITEDSAEIDFSEYEDDTEEEIDIGFGIDGDNFGYTEVHTDDTGDTEDDFSEYEDNDEDVDLATLDNIGFETAEFNNYNDEYSAENNLGGNSSDYNDEVDFSEYEEEDNTESPVIFGKDQYFMNEVDFSDIEQEGFSGGNNGFIQRDIIDTSEFEDTDFPDFELKKYDEPKIYEDDIANKMANILQKISQGAKNFINKKK